MVFLGLWFRFGVFGLGVRLGLCQVLLLGLGYGMFGGIRGWLAGLAVGLDGLVGGVLGVVNKGAVLVGCGAGNRGGRA